MPICFCPSRHRGCPILCGPHLRADYSIDCAAKGGWQRTSTLIPIPKQKCGCPILCGSHVRSTHTRRIAARKGWACKISILTLHQVLEFFSMPKGLRRFCGGGDLHFITCSCYQRKPLLGSASRRDLFL